MPRPFSAPSGSLLAGSVALVAVGIAVNTGLESPLRLLPSLLLTTLGIAGVANGARDYGVERLRLTTKRWWAGAVVAFIPYALVAAPASDSAAAVGDVFVGTTIPLVLEATAGAVVCCAVATTVLYGFASYGIHPGRPSPEERVLSDGGEE
ncbi:DUF1467 domain-containing protein [Haloterrigena alkaliphila]|uniref:DUF1467 domain-containing protein n=1 Tax=Haloterrigena alkaliphila TaxID=2816475 RepID=A0A8A2VAF0_9EURY|nr:DUF1467 domain-containing protein [Haloterrigena alkaliphila]QSW98056.1 DUF1467 domain-containing protein [Haloterrigena alkaliphila]